VATTPQLQTGSPHATRDALAHAGASSDGLSDRALDRYANAHDASHFLLIPRAVAVASDASDVARLFRAAARSQVPVTLRSGGTSLSGQGVTDGLLVDVRRNFRSIEVLDDGRRVRVQSGATVRQVNARLARFGRKLGPDPASEVACTIGGVVANNSSGMQCGIVENTYRTLESMIVVLPSGTVVDTGRADASERLRRDEPELFDGLVGLQNRILRNQASVRTIRQQFSMKNTMGYGLNAFLDHDSPVSILAHLIVGSEGTLGFVAEATFRTVPLLPLATTSLAVFDSLQSANEALPGIVATGASAIELMDAQSLRVGGLEPDAPALIRDLVVEEHAALLIEHQALTVGELDELEGVRDRELAGLRLPTPVHSSRKAEVRAALWHLRKGLYASVAGSRPARTTALLEDVVVPVEALAETCRSLTDLFQRYEYDDSVIFGHAKDGNIHFMITDRFEGEGLDRYASFTESMVDLILGQGGSLKAEHGTGRVMAPYVRRQYGDELYDVMRTIKKLFDPQGALNPGVIITDDPALHLRHIKDTPAIEAEADRCVECGYCEPVCPSRDLTLTPRQRIAVKREIATAAAAGDAELERELSSDYEYAGIQTCAVDGMCQTSCPVLINTGDLVRRLRSDRHNTAESAVWSGAATHWAAGTRVASAALSAAAAVPAPLIQPLNRAARVVLGEETVPLWSPDLPGGGRRRSTSAVRRAEAAQPQAVYVPACVNAMFAPVGRGVQESFEQICERAGVDLVIPEDIDSLCCGTPWSSKGLPEGAQRMRERVVRSVRAATDDGRLPIVCDASSCTEGFRHLLEADTTGPALRVMDVVEFVASRILPSLPPHRRYTSVALHPTCSSTRLGLNGDLAALAGEVADTVIVADDWGCCAFAGDRGMLHPELTASATRVQAEQIHRAGTQVHASCNRTCELGMTRAVGNEYSHILELLAEVTGGGDAGRG
jgi:D-lactate dehydrogenase